MEQWNTGILGLFCIALKNIRIHEINQSWIALWEVFRHQKRTTFRLAMPWLPRRGGYPWHLYQHSWRNYKNWSYCAGGAQEALIQTLKLCVFDHYSMIALKLHCVPNIPSFHVGGIKPVSLKATWFQCIIEIRKRYTRPMAGVTPVWAYHHRKGHPSEKKGGGPICCAPPAI